MHSPFIKAPTAIALSSLLLLSACHTTQPSDAPTQERPLAALAAEERLTQEGWLEQGTVTTESVSNPKIRLEPYVQSSEDKGNRGVPKHKLGASPPPPMFDHEKKSEPLKPKASVGIRAAIDF